MFVVALVGSQTPTGPNGEKSTSVGVGIVIMLFSFIFFYKPSWGYAAPIGRPLEYIADELL